MRLEFMRALVAELYSPLYYRSMLCKVREVEQVLDSEAMAVNYRGEP
jgi:hypothetical protein